MRRNALRRLFRTQLVHRPNIEPLEGVYGVDLVRPDRVIHGFPAKHLRVEFLCCSRIARAKLNPVERSRRVFFYLWHFRFLQLERRATDYKANPGEGSLFRLGIGGLKTLQSSPQLLLNVRLAILYRLCS